MKARTIALGGDRDVDRGRVPAPSNRSRRRCRRRRRRPRTRTSWPPRPGRHARRRARPRPRRRPHRRPRQRPPTASPSLGVRTRRPAHRPSLPAPHTPTRSSRRSCRPCCPAIPPDPGLHAGLGLHGRQRHVPPDLRRRAVSLREGARRLHRRRHDRVRPQRLRRARDDRLPSARRGRRRTSSPRRIADRWLYRPRAPVRPAGHRRRATRHLSRRRHGDQRRVPHDAPRRAVHRARRGAGQRRLPSRQLHSRQPPGPWTAPAYVIEALGGVP